MKTTKVGGSTSDGISPAGWGKVKIRLALKDGTEGLILTLTNVFYLRNSPSNLVSLGLLNDADHHNEDQTLYDLESRKTLAFAERYKTSFLLHPLNLSAAAVNLLRNNQVYERNGPGINQTQIGKLPLTLWHQRLGHLNLASLRKHLTRHNIEFVNDAEGFVCDSCERAKATKQYNRTPQRRAEKPYQYIHTDLVGPITLIGFGGE